MPGDDDEKRKRLEKLFESDKDKLRETAMPELPDPPSPDTPRKPDGTPAH